VHGNDVTTLWTKAFFNETELEEYAIEFSKSNMIVESKDWANMKIENGMDGGRDPGFVGHSPSAEQRAQISKRMQENNPMHNPEAKKKHSETMKSDALKKNRSRSKQGNTNTKGRTWFNNGEISKMLFSPPDGTWTKGRLNPHWNTNRKKNGKVNTN
jgi:hypothetical protein